MVPSTAVLSVGYDLACLLERAPAVRTFPDALDRDDLDAATEAIGAALARSGHALVIYPEWLEEPTLRRLETIRAALSTDRLALHGSALPPLAGGVLCNLASALGEHLIQPGQLAAAMGALQRTLVVAAWLGSLSGLKQPSPSLLQHVVSLWPTSSYGVVLQPEHAIVRTDRPGQDLAIEVAERRMELVLAPREGGDTSWLTGGLNDALGGIAARTVAATRNGPEWWGTSRLVEAVAFPTDLAALAGELASATPMRRCGWCSEAIASAPCPFCRAAEQQDTAGPATSPVAAQVQA